MTTNETPTNPASIDFVEQPFFVLAYLQSHLDRGEPITVEIWNDAIAAERRSTVRRATKGSN